MNDRIKELADKCFSTMPDQEELILFSRLIVKECIRLCDQVDLVGADDCIYFIKEHFGIK